MNVERKHIAEITGLPYLKNAPLDDVKAREALYKFIHDHRKGLTENLEKDGLKGSDLSSRVEEDLPKLVAAWAVTGFRMEKQRWVPVYVNAGRKIGALYSEAFDIGEPDPTNQNQVVVCKAADTVTDYLEAEAERRCKRRAMLAKAGKVLVAANIPFPIAGFSVDAPQTGGMIKPGDLKSDFARKALEYYLSGNHGCLPNPEIIVHAAVIHEHNYAIASKVSEMTGENVVGILDVGILNDQGYRGVFGKIFKETGMRDSMDGGKDEVMSSINAVGRHLETHPGQAQTIAAIIKRYAGATGVGATAKAKVKVSGNKGGESGEKDDPSVQSPAIQRLVYALMHGIEQGVITPDVRLADMGYDFQAEVQADLDRGYVDDTKFWVDRADQIESYVRKGDPSYKPQ